MAGYRERGRASAAGPLNRLVHVEMDAQRRAAHRRRLATAPLPTSACGIDQAGQTRQHLLAITAADAELLARLEAEASLTTDPGA